MKNKVATLITRDPKIFTVSKNVTGLGFKIVKQNKKEVVDLEAKNDMNTILGLAYYNISLFSHRVVESCFAIIVKSHFAKSIEPLSMTQT